MSFNLFDYIDNRGGNDFKAWTESLQKNQRAKLNLRLDMLEKLGPELWPNILTGTPTSGIQKLRIQGNPKLRPLLCKGPIDKHKEFTLLKGAIEKQFKLVPKNADQIAHNRKREIIKDVKRRIIHERIS